MSANNAVVNFNAPTCEPGKCRTNCRKNPNCFSQLGEKFWFSKIKESHWISSDDIEFERRIEDCHVGLKNLGATCYVNTFLQLWFQNKAFRSAVYQWKPKDNVVPSEIIHNPENTYTKTILLDYGDNPTNAICGNLQFLFALLQYSEKRYVDPSSFVQSLGLQTDEQQDAQEFSKLFISLLDDALTGQNNFSTSIIDQQFGGCYTYQTKCNVCNCASETPSRFYELDLNIKGHIKLKECLKEFLKEEILEGDNKYFCSSCCAKQNAMRRIVLKTLPPVLNLQLLRFVFDRQTGTKKKLNSVIEFPDLLDMNDFMKLESPEDGIYNLTAVLIHRGLSAHSGHYIAHIFDQESEVWCRFNDEDVSIMKGKTLQLGKEDDLEDFPEQKPKKIRKTEGHSSKNAYMLVYSRKNTENNKVSDVPEIMKEFVAKDNSLFLDHWIKSHNKRVNAISDGLEKQKEIQAIYACLPVKEGDDYEWISTDWLRQWLNPDQVNIPPIDNTSLMCKHSCADPLKLNMMKRVSAEAAEVLFTRHGGLPRLKSDSLCTTCTESIKRGRDFETQLQADMKAFVKPLKTSYKVSCEGYWVGKKSLKRVKQLALQEFRNREEGILSNPDISMTDSPSRPEDTEDQNNNGNQPEECSSKDQLSTPKQTNSDSAFNQDCQCSEHGNLCVHPSLRVLVSKDIWLKLLEYFPRSQSFSNDILPCQECQNKEKSSQEERETMKYLANEQKGMFSFLLEKKSDRLKSILHEDHVTLHVILASFIETWKKSVKSNGRKLLTHIDNTEIICEHDLLLYSAEEIVSEATVENPQLVLVSEEEFSNITNFFTITNDVVVTANVAQTDDQNTRKYVYKVSPDFCPECRSNRLSEEAHDSKMYRGAPIFIMKRVVKSSSVMGQNSPLEDRNDEQDSMDTKHGLYGKESKDTSYTSSAKKIKRSASPEGGRRRSSRHRTKRGEYMVRVDSDQTLKQLKIQLLNTFSILPIEQTLSLPDGTVLQDNEAFLVNLGITPGTHILLSVDEPSAERSVDDSSCGKPRALEEGFKGTNLYGGGKA